MKEIQKIFNSEIKVVENKKLEDLSGISNKISTDKTGIYYLNLIFKDNNSKQIVVKTKTRKFLIKGIKLLSKNSVRLKLGLLKSHKVFSYDKSYKREITIYSDISKLLKEYMIKYHGTYIKSGIYNIVFDYYDIENKKLTVDITKKIFDAIIKFHEFYYGKNEIIKEMNLNYYTSKDYKKAKKSIDIMFNYHNKENLKYFGSQLTKKLNDFINNIDKEVSKYSYHRTFTHNDFSTRNIFYTDDEIYLYDFELACFQNPEHDLIEFLLYELNNFNDDEIIDLINYYKDNLLNKINNLVNKKVDFNKYEYKELLLFNVYEFTVTRLSLLRMARGELNISFIDTLLINIKRLINIIEEKYE